MSTTVPNYDEQQQSELKNFGQRIKELRIKAGYSSAERFAIAHGIHPEQYRKYEIGVNMRFSSLHNLTEAFGISMTEFFSAGFD